MSSKYMVGKVAEALPAIMRSVAAAILRFLDKAVGTGAEHTWASIVFVARPTGISLIDKVKNQKKS